MREPWQTVQPAALSDQRGSFAYQTDLESAQLMQFICSSPLSQKRVTFIGWLGAIGRTTGSSRLTGALAGAARRRSLRKSTGWAERGLSRGQSFG